MSSVTSRSFEAVDLIIHFLLVKNHDEYINDNININNYNVTSQNCLVIRYLVFPLYVHHVIWHRVQRFRYVLTLIVLVTTIYALGHV